MGRSWYDHDGWSAWLEFWFSRIRLCQLDIQYSCYQARSNCSTVIQVDSVKMLPDSENQYHRLNLSSVVWRERTNFCILASCQAKRWMPKIKSLISIWISLSIPWQHLRKYLGKKGRCLSASMICTSGLVKTSPKESAKVKEYNLQWIQLNMKFQWLVGPWGSHLEG